MGRIAELVTSENKNLKRRQIGLVVEDGIPRLARPGEAPTDVAEVRQPTIEERGAIFRAGGGRGIHQTEGADVGAMAVEAALLCTVKPGSPGLGEREFDLAHRDNLRKQPANGIVEALGAAVLELMKDAGDSAGKGSTASPA